MIKYLQRRIAGFLGGKAQENYLSAYIIQNSIQLFLLQGFSLLLTFISNFVLIKVAGVTDYGWYVYIFNLVYLLVGFCVIGMDTLLVKRVAIYESADDNGKVKGVIFLAFGICFAVSLLVTLVTAAIRSFRDLLPNNLDWSWFTLCLSTLLLLAVITLNQAALQGLKKIALSQIGEKLVRPVVLILSTLLLFFYKKRLDLEELIWINVISLSITVIITSVLLQKNIKDKLKNVRAAYETKSWIPAALAFFIVGVLYLLNSRIDIFLLGLFRGHDEVAVYNVVLKVSEIVSFGLITVNYIMAPAIAKLFSNGDLSQLQQLIRRAAQVVLVIGLPLLLLIVIFRKTILVFVGVDFLNGEQALLILCAGQLVNVLCGSVGTILIMSGYQRFSIYSLAISTCFGIILNLLLTPRFGLVGTATATASSIAVWNCLMYFFVSKKIKIRSTAF